MDNLILLEHGRAQLLQHSEDQGKGTRPWWSITSTHPCRVSHRDTQPSPAFVARGCSEPQVIIGSASTTTAVINHPPQPPLVLGTVARMVPTVPLCAPPAPSASPRPRGLGAFWPPLSHLRSCPGFTSPETFWWVWVFFV